MQQTKRLVEALPRPDADSERHSSAVAAHIAERIRAAGGSVSFAEFMQEALYAPRLGYYSAGAAKFGAGGDFVTAPEISPLFGRVVAHQAAPVLAALGGGDILEPGAGSGALAISILGKLEELRCLPERYLILEVSADLAERQRRLVAEKLPTLVDRVHWIAGLPTDFRGVVVANEVLDALPVERFGMAGRRVMQLRVGAADGGFAWRQAPAPTLLEEAVRDVESVIGRKLEDGFESELSLGLGGWIGDLAASLDEALVLLVDYGVSRREYYAADRRTGWLRCHFRHHVHDDPLILPGIQDLTAWVDFTAVAEAATAAGLRVAGYLTQAHWLLGGGLEAELQAFAELPVAEQIRLSGQVKLLTLPGEMGENFKCLALGTGAVEAPAVFSAADRAHLL
jgi:SAM-dependent MidA family methyltransferase